MKSQLTIIAPAIAGAGTALTAASTTLCCSGPWTSAVLSANQPYLIGGALALAGFSSFRAFRTASARPIAFVALAISLLVAAWGFLG